MADWKKFGLDVVMKPVDGNSYFLTNQIGNYDTQYYWPSINVITDATAMLRYWHKDQIVPNGVNAPGGGNTGACTRWRSETVSALVDKAVATPSDDPRVIGLITEIMKELVREQPFAPLTGTSKLVPVVSRYWDGFQTAENHFEGPWWWWSNFRFSPSKYRPAGE